MVHQFLILLTQVLISNQEFPNVAASHLLTKQAIKNHDEPSVDTDVDYPSHSTCTAGKALGALYGASKKATLIVVRLHDITSEEFEEALELILDDLEQNPDRKKKSVVVASLTFDGDWEPDLIEDVSLNLRKLFDDDVPFVCIAGNEAEDPGRESVDEYPALLEGPDLPLLVVGSANSTGERSQFSQGGPHVSIYAMGEDITCLPAQAGGDLIDDSGTSFGMCQWFSCCSIMTR